MDLPDHTPYTCKQYDRYLPLFPQLTLFSFSSFNTFNALIVQILPLCNHLSGNISATPACNACGQNAHSITLPHPTLSNAAFAIRLELGMKNPCPTTLH